MGGGGSFQHSTHAQPCMHVQQCSAVLCFLIVRYVQGSLRSVPGRCCLFCLFCRALITSSRSWFVDQGVWQAEGGGTPSFPLPSNPPRSGRHRVEVDRMIRGGGCETWLRSCRAGFCGRGAGVGGLSAARARGAGGASIQPSG